MEQLLAAVREAGVTPEDVEIRRADLEDVFIHIEVLRHSGFADLQAGEAVGLRIVEGKRGRMAVQVVSWDSALRG